MTPHPFFYQILIFIISVGWLTYTFYHAHLLTKKRKQARSSYLSLNKEMRSKGDQRSTFRSASHPFYLVSLLSSPKGGSI